jgi:CheY-like chemotaxis protein
MEKIKIIIVENDEDEQFFMKDGFESSGYFLILAIVNNGDELLEILDNNQPEQPDMILSDLNMPGRNGYDILKELRADTRYRKLPIVITSTSSIKSVIDNCMRLGATKFIQKPETFVEYEEYAKQLAEIVKAVKI